MRAATSVKVRPPPTPTARTLFLSSGRAPSHPFCCLIEQAQPRFPIFGDDVFAGRDNPNQLACGDPIDLIARPDVKLISDGLRQGNLVLRRDLCHILTLARNESLFQMLSGRELWNSRSRKRSVRQETLKGQQTKTAQLEDQADQPTAWINLWKPTLPVGGGRAGN